MSARSTPVEPADASCVREAPRLDVWRLDAEAGEHRADLLAMDAPVVEHLGQDDARRTLVRPEARTLTRSASNSSEAKSESHGRRGVERAWRQLRPSVGSSR